MRILNQIECIDKEAWSCLIMNSPVSTWFQTPEAFSFFASIGSNWDSFVYAIENEGRLKAVAVGVTQKDGGRIKQFFSRRTIIMGGPVVSEDITDEELSFFLQGIKQGLKGRSIYIEMRNLNSYEKWKEIFIKNGFDYEPHLNYIVHCGDWNQIEQRIGKHRRRYIRQTIREGASIIEHPTLEQVRQYYALLEDLYKTKVKRPLYPWRFFEQLYALDTSLFLLIEFDGQVIGGSVCVCLANKSVYEWFACGKDGLYKNVHPSSLTKYAGIQYANNNNYQLFDMMGAGKPGEQYGVRDFKAEFGGELVEYGRFRYVANKPLFALGKMAVTIMKWL